MSGSKSYEVYVYRSGNWNIDSVYDDRQMAIYEAQKILERRGKTAVGAVRVIEEALDPNTGESHSKVVFRALKKPGDEPKTTDRAASLAKQTAARRSKEAESSDSQAERGSGRQDAEAKLVRYMVMLVLSVGGIALVLIVGMALLVHFFRP